MEKQEYIAYYESTIYDDEDDRLAIIAALHRGDTDCRWYPEPIPESFFVFNFKQAVRRRIAGRQKTFIKQLAVS